LGLNEQIQAKDAQIAELADLERQRSEQVESLTARLAAVEATLRALEEGR
jgi:hypothetical protein